MTWEEVNKDMDAYQAALDTQTSTGVDRRVAEGRARRAGIRAYLKAHPEEEAEHAAKARTAAPAGAAAPAAVAGNGGQAPAAAAPRPARGFAVAGRRSTPRPSPR